jgi:hypothetical protein
MKRLPLDVLITYVLIMYRTHKDVFRVLNEAQWFMSLILMG